MIGKRKNIVDTIPSQGKMEFRHLTVGDSIEISHLLATTGMDDREFVLRVLHRQLVLPKQRISEFRKITDKELEKISRTVVANEPHSFQYLKDSGNLFADIKTALSEYQLQQLKKRLSFSPGLASTTKKLNALNNVLTTTVRQALERYQDIIKSTQRDSQKFEALLKSNVAFSRVTTLTFSPALDLARKQFEEFNKQFASVAQQTLDKNRNIIQVALRSVPSLHRELAKIKVDMTMPFLGVADQYTKMAQIAMNQLKPQIEYFQDWITKNQRVFDPIWKSWDEIEKKNKIAEKQAAKILRKYKWFICPSMPVTAIRAILEVAKKKGRKDGDINKLFVDYFSRNEWKNLEDMVLAWDKNKLFAPRMPILKNCVKVMQSADKDRSNGAIVVLPTLISQIDGLLTDFLDKHNIPYKTMYDDFVQGGKTKKVGRKSQFKANVPNALTDELNDLAQDMFLNILFQSSQRGKPLATPFNFNRHKIMHGEIVKFGRKDYVVRAFMVLDFLAFLK